MESGLRGIELSIIYSPSISIYSKNSCVNFLKEEYDMQKIVGILSVAVLGLVYLLVEAVQSNKRLTKDLDRSADRFVKMATEKFRLETENEELQHRIFLLECETGDDI